MAKNLGKDRCNKTIFQIISDKNAIIFKKNSFHRHNCYKYLIPSNIFATNSLRKVTACPPRNRRGHDSIVACPLTFRGGYAAVVACPLTFFGGYVAVVACPLAFLGGYAAVAACPLAFLKGYTRIVACPPRIREGHATKRNRLFWLRTARPRSRTIFRSLSMMILFAAKGIAIRMLLVKDITHEQYPLRQRRRNAGVPNRPEKGARA